MFTFSGTSRLIGIPVASVHFNFADPFYQYPERRRLRDHGNHNDRNKKVNYNIAEIISNLKSIYNQMGLKKFVDAIKGTTKKLLLMILQKVLENKNKFERRFVDILSVCVGRSRQYSKEVNLILTEIN